MEASGWAIMNKLPYPTRFKLLVPPKYPVPSCPNGRWPITAVVAGSLASVPNRNILEVQISPFPPTLSLPGAV